MSDVGRAVIEMPESEDSLRGEAQRSRSVLDQITIAVLIFDCDLVLRQINRCALEGIGAHLEHAIGRSLPAILADRYDSETCASLVAHFERTLRTGVAFRQREWSLGQKKKDPEDHFIDWEIQLLQRPDGGPDGVLLSATDVTKQVLVRRELEQVSKRYQAFADGLPQLAYTVQPDGGLDYVNRLWRSYTGLDLERTRSSGWRAAIHPDDLPPTDAGWVRARAIGSPFELEQRIRAFDGAYRWHLTRCWPVRGENGDIVQWIGTCTDIHHKRAHEEAIRQANSELQQFAYVASHDLQEPLRMVTGYLSLLQRRCSASLDEAAKEYVGFAFDGATRMQKIILHLLDFARVGQGSLRISQFDSGMAYRDALANLSLLVASTQGAVTCDPLPVVSADKDQLMRLFQNLIANALTYHRSGSPPVVQIRAERTVSEWIFSVRDQGIGIALENQTRIFDVFQRLHARDDYSGTGMGLAICRRIVERHRGRLWVTSEPGVGSIFYFSLPVATRMLEQSG